MSALRRAAAGLALLALAGCGAHGTTGASGSSSANAQDAAVKFAECMRQHGVQVDDPRPGEPGIRIRTKLDESKVNAAMQACRKYNPHKNVDPNDPRARDHMLKMAQCLRAHGVQIADPQPGQGLRIQVRKGDPKVQQAIEACNKQVPPPSPAAHG